MIKCPICKELREKTAPAWAEEIALEDELKMTRKNDPVLGTKREVLKRAQGQTRDFLNKEMVHRREAHVLERAAQDAVSEEDR
jgi:hypothetical protein